MVLGVFSPEISLVLFRRCYWISERLTIDSTLWFFGNVAIVFLLLLLVIVQVCLDFGKGEEFILNFNVACQKK